MIKAVKPVAPIPSRHVGLYASRALEVREDWDETAVGRIVEVGICGRVAGKVRTATGCAVIGGIGK